MYSFLVEWNERVYRLSIICYTRESIGNFVEKNYIGLHMRRKLRDFQVENNGMHQYKDFCLKEIMNEHMVKDKKLVPSKEHLTKTYFERNPKSIWNGQFKAKELKWLKFTWKKIKIDKIIQLHEFINRYGYISSFAHQINKFLRKHNGNRVQSLQLHYMALLQTSQIQFYYIMKLMIDKKKGTYTNRNIFREYQKEAHSKELVLNGGPQPRIQCPLLHNYAFLVDDQKLEENLQKLEEGVKALEDGDFLDNNSNIKLSLSHFKIGGIGPFASISFPSLTLFTGLCKPTKSAVCTAKQSLVNSTTPNSYFHKMKSFCKEHDKGFSINLDDVSFYLTAWRFIATSWGDVCASIENGMCGTFRGKHRLDVYFHGQDLYNLQCNSDDIWVKILVLVHGGKYLRREWNDNKNPRNTPFCFLGTHVGFCWCCCH